MGSWTRSLDGAAWWLSGLFDRSDLSIRYRPGSPVRVRGTVPRAQAAAISAYLVHDWKSRTPATIKGTRAGGVWRVRISGGPSRAEAQRLRNFLIEELR